MNAFQRYNVEAAIIRAKENHQREIANSALNRLRWEEDDKKFCEERYPLDKEKKGVYTVVEHWDGIHIVLNENTTEEHIFGVEFRTKYDAEFSLKIHELVKPVPKPIITEKEDDGDGWI